MLLPLFEWFDGLRVGDWISTSSYAAPLINVMHILALVILFGSLLIVDVRLLGRGMTQQPVAKVARDARPWLIGALICMLLTGIPQVLSLPVREYYSPFLLAEDAAPPGHVDLHVHAPTQGDHGGRGEGGAGLGQGRGARVHRPLDVDSRGRAPDRTALVTGDTSLGSTGTSARSTNLASTHRSVDQRGLDGSGHGDERELPNSSQCSLWRRCSGSLGGVGWSVPTRSLKPSQRCARCWETTRKSLSQRIHHCAHCGFTLDRDWNAALVALIYVMSGNGREPAACVRLPRSGAGWHETPCRAA